MFCLNQLLDGTSATDEYLLCYQLIKSREYFQSHETMISECDVEEGPEYIKKTKSEVSALRKN